jgi:hypothetical protein
MGDTIDRLYELATLPLCFEPKTLIRAGESAWIAFGIK